MYACRFTPAISWPLPRRTRRSVCAGWTNGGRTSSPRDGLPRWFPSRSCCSKRRYCVPVIRHRQTCILVGILVILVVSGVSATLPQMISQGGREANWNCTYQFKIKQPTTILTRAGCSFVLHSIICMQLVLWLSTSLLLLLTIATCCTVC